MGFFDGSWVISLIFCFGAHCSVVLAASALFMADCGFEFADFLGAFIGYSAFSYEVVGLALFVGLPHKQAVIFPMAHFFYFLVRLTVVRVAPGLPISSFVFFQVGFGLVVFSIWI
jgi:hypothetical protein